MALSAQQIATINAFDLSGLVPHLAVKISHPNVQQPIRVINDNQDLIVDGNRFVAFAFRLIPPETRENEIPRAFLEVTNVGQRLLTWIEATRGGEGSRVEFSEVVATGEDSSGNRTGTTVWSMVGFSFGTISITNRRITAELTTLKSARVPGVKIFNDPHVLPGLF